MQRSNIISGLVLALFAGLMLAVVIPAQIEPGPSGMMSPRLVPNLMMGAILILSLLLILTNLRGAATQDAPPVTRAELAALARLGGLFAVSVLLFRLMPLAGGVALVAGGLWLLGERRLWVIAGYTAILLTAIWALFYQLLGTAIL